MDLRRASAPDVDAWPPTSADLAAERRHRTRDRAVATVRAPASADIDAIIALTATATAVEAGAPIRRIDVELAPDDELERSLVEHGWVVGRTAELTIASWLAAVPWRPARAEVPAWASRLPGRPRRWVRQARAIGDVPFLERAAILAEEVRGHTAQGLHLASTYRAVPVPKAPRGRPFTGTRFRIVADALDLVSPELARTTFLDIGCGDGRVLIEARRRGFAAGLGRELDARLADRAARRTDGWAAVEHLDATFAPIPDDVGVVFLNNPFGADGVERIAQRIGDRLASSTAPLLLLYANPQAIEPLLRAGLALVEIDPAFCAFASRPLEPPLSSPS